jgi:alpha-ketoglutarate-dependent taurine dioxygenase
MLEFLFKHQSQDQYLYSHKWTPGDVLMWDNIATTHNAVSDYGPGRAALHPARAGDGHARLRPPGGLSGGAQRCGWSATAPRRTAPSA